MKKKGLFRKLLLKIYPKNSAYTLLELSIVLVITAFLVTGVLSIATYKSVKDSTLANTEILKKIDKALVSHYVNYGYLPCPAPLNAAISTTGYGMSTNCNVAAPVGTTEVGAGDNIVRTGAIPVRTLGLADNDMFDYWGNRITYAMIRNLGINKTTYDATLPATNAIVIEDTNNNQEITSYISPNHVAFVIISHGPNNTGAYNYMGTQAVACGGAGVDVENCNSDAVFRDSYFVPNSYDDTILWETRQMLKYSSDFLNKTVSGGAASTSPTYVAHLTYQTFGQWVGAPGIGWNTRIINSILYNDIPGLSLNSPKVTVPPGTYYIRATTTGCLVNNFLTRVKDANTGSVIAVGSAGYAGNLIKDCAISEAVGVSTFNVNTDIQVDEYIAFSAGAGYDYSWGATPVILDNTPIYQEPYTTSSLEIQKWR